MADRIEREINEILAKLDDLPDETVAPERSPISIAEHRERRSEKKPRTTPRLKVPKVNATAALLTGAGTVIGGLLLSSLWAPLLWAAFGGVVIFVAGFVSALVKTPRPGKQAPPGGHFWRDRYIQYSQPQPGPQDTWSKLKRRLRR
ncbi:MAG: hypothetical protein AB7T37_00980 [Dehalococcoidia bacterium]